MASSGYATWTVTAGEVPTTSKWNILGGNDAAFNTGNGFNDGIITPRHFALNSVPGQAHGIQSQFFGFINANVALSNGIWTPVSYNAQFINAGASAYVVNGNQITVPYTGSYEITIVNSFNQATGFNNYLTGLAINNTSAPTLPWVREYMSSGIGLMAVMLTLTWPLNAGDKLTGFAYSGGSGSAGAVVLTSSGTAAGGAPYGGDTSYINISYKGTIA